MCGLKGTPDFGSLLMINPALVSVKYTDMSGLYFNYAGILSFIKEYFLLIKLIIIKRITVG